MKIISWNVNGLRSIYNKRHIEWLFESRADFLCLQEIKLQEAQIPKELLDSSSYQLYLNCAEKKGYSGVAVLTNKKPLRIKTKLGLKRFDSEGRMIQLEYRDFVLICLYLPHGGRSKANLQYKLEVYSYLLAHIKKIKNKNVILVGDFNIAHKEVDLSRPRDNKNNIMFTLEEREQIDELIDFGFVDSFREFYQEPGNYTWWTYMANARQRNIGWRIDYIFMSLCLSAKLKDAFVFREVMGSDHCPIGIEF